MYTLHTVYLLMQTVVYLQEKQILQAVKQVTQNNILDIVKHVT